MKSKINLLARIMVLSCLIGSVQASELQVLRMGVSPGYAPFESKTGDGKLVGFDIDIGNELCNRMSLRCVWVDISFDGLIPALQAQKIDLINSAMNITEKRQQAITFTKPVYVMPIQMVARKDSGLQPTVASLKGKSVGVQQGTSQEDYIKTHWVKAGVNLVSYQEQDMVFMDLAAGRLDAAVQEAQTAQEVFLSRQEGHDFAFAGQPLKDPATLGQGTGIGIRKQNIALHQQVEQKLDEMKKDGTLERLSMNYFKRNIIAE